MLSKSELVIQGYLSLPEADQKKVDDALKGLRIAEGMVKRAAAEKMIKAAHPRISLGPVNQSCPCCNR